MKNKSLRRCLAAALSVVLMLSALAVPVQAAKSGQSGAIRAKKYTMDLKLDTKKNSLSEKITIQVKNSTKKRVKRLYFRNMAHSILAYDRENYPEKENKKLSCEIKSVKVQGRAKRVHYARDRSVFYVNLGDQSIGTGKSVKVTIRARTDVPLRDDRFGYHKNKSGKLYNLSMCIPCLAPYRNGEWNRDPYFDDGETRAAEVTNYQVTFTAPKSYAVAATGTHKTKKGVTTISAKNMRDFAIVCCDHMKKDSFQVKGITVNSYYLPGKYKDRYRTISKLVAKDTITLLTDQIGALPYKQLDMAPCYFGFGFGGMEYPGLVMNNASAYYGEGTDTARSDPVSHQEVVAHEVAHQWFFAAVGNDEYKEGWLDEGFTTYCEQVLYAGADTKSGTWVDEHSDPRGSLKARKDYIRENLTMAQQEQGPCYVNIPVSAYSEEDSYSEREYYWGRAFLQELRAVMGQKKFSRFLKSYYKDNCLKVSTTARVLKAIRAQDNSKEVNRIIKKYVSEKYL